MDEPKSHLVKIDLRVNGQRLSVEGPMPPEIARVDELLPLFFGLVDADVEQAIALQEREGKKISCRRGCSACCRAQPVPVTPFEAFWLLLLVEGLPEPWRNQVQERFAHNVAMLEQAGLIDEYDRTRSELTMESARSIAMKYFSLGLCCPFLVENACSIYEQRPFVCRQYLVTSPAALCDDPFQHSVEVVPMRLKPATATLRALSEIEGTACYTIPLALALRYAEEHRAELEKKYESESLARRWIMHLCE